MPALELDRLSWPEVREEIASGRDTVVVALGATEQHGAHLPLATDALLGDHFAREVAERLDAFVAPTVRIGCSSHHLGYPGTISIGEETFGALVADLVGSLARGGFSRIVLIPSHGGNFAPLAAALARLEEPAGARVLAITDVTLLLRLARIGEEEFGVPVAEGGLHGGEWETSMLAAIHPELVAADRAEPGYVGPPEEAVPKMLESGVAALSESGVVGDPTSSTPERGRRYWEAATEIILAEIARLDA